MSAAYKNRLLPSTVLCLLFTTIFTLNVHAINGSQLQSDIVELENLSAELKKNILPLLTLIKEFEKSNQFTTIEIVKTIQPDIAIKEADNPASTTIYTAQHDEEFELLEYQEPWIKIKLQDGREGWVQDENVQILEKQELVGGPLTSNRKRSEATILLTQMASYESRINDLFEISNTLIFRIQEQYQKLSDQRKTMYADAYGRFQNNKSTIEKYPTYLLYFIRV